MTAQRSSAHYGLPEDARADRDQRIRQMTADGCTVAKIAEDLGCDKRTVYNARANDVDLALRREARSIASSMVKFKQLITEAKTRNIHSQKGFTSWPAYVADVIGKEMPALAADDRRQIIALLAGEGMSQRAIAEVVGVSQKTVDRDLDQLSRDDSVDLPERVTGRDGKSRPARKPKPAPAPPLTPPDVDLDLDLCILCGQLFARVEMYPDEDSDGTVIGYVCENCVDTEDNAVGSACMASDQASGSISSIRMEATHIAAKIKVLPDHIFNQSYPVVMRLAAVESFYTSVRTMIEFLGVRPVKVDKRDSWAGDTLIDIQEDWKPKLSDAERETLIGYWELASEHLMHFSKTRTAVGVDADETVVRQIKADVLAVWDQFADISNHGLVPLAENNHIYDEPPTTTPTGR